MPYVILTLGGSANRMGKGWAMQEKRLGHHVNLSFLFLKSKM
jgi:hypothetical protein